MQNQIEIDYEGVDLPSDKVKSMTTYIREICYFLDINPLPKFIFRNIKKSYCRSRLGCIEVGLKYDDSLEYIRYILTHELVHMLGIHHSRISCELGYYSSWYKDTLTPKVEDWIFNGGKKPVELSTLQKTYERKWRR